MKIRVHLTLIGFACFMITGCQTPEERAMSQMKRQMRMQSEMMQQMQKSMEEMDKQMEAMEKRMSETNK